MTITVIQNRLDQYQCQNPLEEENALKEITQEIGLLALSRSEFFSHAEFHGGTALRILYGLQRFSEDLDFALIKPNPDFALNKFLDHMSEEFKEYGYNIEVYDRSKADSTIKKAFLKDRSIGKELKLQHPLHDRNRKTLRIKFEVDVNPPQGAITELQYLDFPVPYSVLCKDLPSAFAGKLHALLCRSYIKGRDWFDFVWYVSQGIKINFELLKNALNQMGPWQDQNISINQTWLITQLQSKVAQLDWEKAKADVIRFLRPRDQKSLAVWSAPFFQSRVAKLAGTLDKQVL